MAKKIMILNAAQKAWETRRANAAASATLPTRKPRTRKVRPTVAAA
jgi:hypothetical protein